MRGLVRLVVLGVAGSAVLLTSYTQNAGAAGKQATEEPPSLVETYDYPGAAKVLADRGIELLKGDGHIWLVECGTDPNHPAADLILVQSKKLDFPNGASPNFCFQTKGNQGYLTMSIPEAYFVRGNNKGVISAKVQSRTDPTKVDVSPVDPGQWKSVGDGQTAGEANIVELRFPYVAPSPSATP